MKNRFKQLLENDYFPYIVLVLCLIIFCLTNYSVNHDDVAFAGYPSKYSSCLSFINIRYHNWSSRVIIEAIIYNLIVHPTIWKILNILIMLLLLHSILKITDSLKIYWIKYVALVLILLIPTTVLYEVGFIVTSINYLWTTTLSLYGLSVIVDLIKGKKISNRKGILYLLASFIPQLTEKIEQKPGFPSLLAFIMSFKFVLGVPLARLSRVMSYQEINLSKEIMCKRIIYTSFKLLLILG